MNYLKDKFLPKEDFTDHWPILEYMRRKHAPEAEKLAKLSGEYTLLSRLCPNPDEFKPVKDRDIAARSPHVSLEEYGQLFGYDGCHWNSKQSSLKKYCFSLYPTLKMLQGANYVMVMPQNCLVRYVNQKIQQKWLVRELFDWKN